MTLLRTFKDLAKRVVYPNWLGTCPICESRVRFFATGDWYRDQLFCGSCFSIPRERAIMRVINLLYPDWRKLRIHESSPGERGASVKLRRECEDYTASQYDPSIPFGSLHERGYVSEDLGHQTFADESFDLVITQDVFEHLLEPDLAIREIARTLRPGGAHIMTVPIVRKAEPSRRRASLVDGQIKYHLGAEYHGNPMDEGGALVTVDWGYDIAQYLAGKSGFPTSIFTIDDVEQGIRAEYIDVVVTTKAFAPDL